MWSVSTWLTKTPSEPSGGCADLLPQDRLEMPFKRGRRAAVHQNELRGGGGPKFKQQAVTELHLNRVEREHGGRGSDRGETRKIFARDNQSEILWSA